MTRTVVVIPARHQSSRFPGKPLVPLLGKAMILWVAELSEQAVGRENVYIATDDDRIRQCVENAGFQAVMTSASAPTGTDRIAEAATRIDATWFINVQGDEPLLQPADIRKVIDLRKAYPDDVVNAYTTIGPNEDPNNPNIPKVVVSESDRLIYMSRTAVPGFKQTGKAPNRYFKQVCIYGFSLDDLLQFSSLGRKSLVETSEDIEILRFFEFGRSIRMAQVRPSSVAVDIPEDVSRAEYALRCFHE